MKTQNFGTARAPDRFYWPGSYIHLSRSLLCVVAPPPPWLAIKNYRENRENGTDQDNPKNPFPSTGFDALDIKNSGWQGSDKWPDKQGRYWWKITLNDGRIIEDFYWTEDKVPRFSDKSNKKRYWFIVHHKNGMKIEGFSQEPNYEKGFPDKNKNYWYTIRFSDTHCPAIRQWMEEKDKNYLARTKGHNKSIEHITHENINRAKQKYQQAAERLAREETANQGAKRQESQQQAARQQEKNASQPTTYTRSYIPSASPHMVQQPVSNMADNASGTAETLVFDPETGQLVPRKVAETLVFDPETGQLIPESQSGGKRLQAQKISEEGFGGDYYLRGPFFSYYFPRRAMNALQAYRKKREKGNDIDNPNRPFPSEGFDALDTTFSELTLEKIIGEHADDYFYDFSEKDGVNGWQIQLNNGTILKDFYWRLDPRHKRPGSQFDALMRAYPDEQGRYWYIIGGRGIEMEGFSLTKVDRTEEYERRQELPYKMEYHECGAIKQWMEEKDRNYLSRLKREEEEDAQQSQQEEQKKRKEKAKGRVKETALLKSPLKAVSAKDTKALLALGKKEDTAWREVDRHGNNVFHIAAKKGSVRVLKQLIESVPLSLQKTLLRRMNDEGEMPHHIAAKAGKIEWIQALIPLGVDFAAKTEEGKTAEQLSVEHGHAILAQVLGNMSQSQGRNEGVQQPPGPGHSSLTTFQAMYDFQPEVPGQLSVQKDDVLTVLQQNPDGWWHCQNCQGQQGWVPMNFLAPWQGRSKSGNTPSPEQTNSSHSSESHSQENEDVTPKPPSKSGSGGSRTGLDGEGKGSVDLIIPNSDLVIGRELGKGTFGAVYQGNWHGTGVAIKKLLAQTLSKNVEEDFLHEAGLMMQLQHENVVRLYGVSLNPYGMVLEFMAKGSLDRVLHSTEPMSWQWRYTISLDVAKGLAFLHRKRVLHRDLKSLNVLLDEHNKAKLGDFGLSRIKTSSSQTGNVGMAGTMQWIAPELLMDTMGRYTPACDVYSYGMLLWELLSRQIPYSKISNRALIPVHVMQGKREEMPKNSPHILSTLTTQCWAHDAKARPSMATVVKSLQDNAVTDTTPERSPYDANEPSPSTLPPQGQMSGSGYQPSFQSGTMTGWVLPQTPSMKSGYAPSQFFQTPQRAMSNGYAPSFQPHGMPRRLPTTPGQYAGQPASAGGYAPSQPFFQPPPQNTQSGYGYPAPFQGGGPLPQPPQNNHHASGSPSGYGYASSGYEKKGQS